MKNTCMESGIAMDTKPVPKSIPDMESSSTTAISTHSASQGVEALKDVTFGSIAGIAGKVVEYPFDTVKVRLQSQPDHLPLRYKGPLDCFRQSIAQDGIRGLYRGVSAPFAGAAAETACLFWSYRVAQDFLTSFTYGRDSTKSPPLPLSGLVTAGAISGAITSIILTPIELVKCRMQVPVQSTLDSAIGSRGAGLNNAPLSPFTVIADVYRREGSLGFWRGHLGTFLRETGGTAAWFGSYEACSLFFKNRLLKESQMRSTLTSASDLQIPIHLQMASGAVAGMSYNFMFYPADTIKSKMQTGELSTAGARPTFMGVGTALWGTHGLKGLYRGCGITVARSAPSSALIFTIVENVKRMFG